MIKVITDEERKVFMNGFPDRRRSDLVSGRTDDIKGEDEEKFFVEKVIKMHGNKKGKEEFLVKWVGYPGVRLLGNHLKVFLVRNHVSI
jgi:hypothetical protein